MSTFASTHATAAERSEADLQRDATSKPFEVLEFFGVEPGMTVLDFLAGGGYYSEVLSQLVGEEGKVYLHNNAAYMGFVQGLDERVADGRLANVELYQKEVEEVDIEPNSVDLALAVMTYHDVYFVSDGWTVTADPTFEMLRRVIKPGGVLAIIDHHAEPGSGNSRAGDIHRIDAEFAKADIESRGFKLVAESDLLENPDDDLTKSVFDPAVRRKTSRFIYKFERTE